MFQSEAVLFHPGDFLQKAEYLLGTGAHIVFCCFCIHGFFQSSDSSYYWKESVNPCLVAVCGIFCNTACKSNCFCSIFLSQLCNPHRSLSHSSLMVKAALSGNHNICIFHFIFQMNRTQNQLDSGSKLAIQIT